jgi:hypothetical protein
LIILRRGAAGEREEYGELVEIGAGLTLDQNAAGQPRLRAANAGAGFSGFPLDVPVAVHACDDDFDGETLDPKWSQAVDANDITVTTGSGWMTMEPSASGTGSLTGRTWGIIQPSPTGPFEVSAKLANNASITGTDSYDGILIGELGGKGQVWGMGRNILNSLTLMETNTYGEGASDWGAFNGTNQVQDLARSVHFTWYRVVWDGSDLHFYFSQNGVFWTLWSTLTARGQPDRIGLGMYATGNTFHADKAMGADWFRVVE